MCFRLICLAALGTAPNPGTDRVPVLRVDPADLADNAVVVSRRATAIEAEIRSAVVPTIQLVDSTSDKPMREDASLIGREEALLDRSPSGRQ